MSKIKNFRELAKNDLRKKALEIAEAGLAAIDTQKIIREAVVLTDEKLVVKDKEFLLKDVRRIFVVGVGKCSLEAATALEKILGNKIHAGVVADIREGELSRIKYYQATHPFPSEINVKITSEIIKLLSGLNEDDLVIFIISGGGSTILCQSSSLDYQDEAAVLDRLIRSGAEIQEINTLRKHLSVARGGYLAKYAYPARVASLIFSDVVGNRLEFVSSGPTVKDTTTLDDAKKILEKHNSQGRFDFFMDKIIETPKEEKYFEKVDNILLVSNKIALSAMADKASELGLTAKIMTDKMSGEAKDVGLKIIEDLNKVGGGSALLYGGETTVTIKEKGHGGRNQELGLSALRSIRGDQALVALASDGHDNSEIAGVLCDIITKDTATEKGLDLEKYLAVNLSYDFWQKNGDFLLTGPTGSNISDLIIAIYESR